MRRLATAFICLLTITTRAHAQAPPVRLTVEEAVAMGLEASHRLAEFVAREDAARALTAQREAATRPQIALIGSYTRSNHVDEFVVPNATGGVRVLYPDIPDTVRSRVDLQWPIYTGGRLQSLTKAAGAEAEATAQDREAARADLKLEITRAYWAVITARASEEVVTRARERTEAQLTDVRNQLGVGLVPPSDVFSVEAQHARQQMLAIEAANIVENTSTDFRRLVGLSPEAPFELTSTLLPTAQPFRAVVNSAGSIRAERKALEFRISAASDRVTAASAGRLPVLSAIGGYDFARPNLRIFPVQKAWKPSWDIGVNVRWPLFDGGRTRAEVAEAVANTRVLEARLRDFDAGIEVEIRQRAADLRSAQASVDATRAGVRAAAEAGRVLAERFGAGVATTTDVLTAQVALLQAELDLTRALANTQLAAARLDRAVGR
jgi:outer membrane protein TolC